MVNHKITTADHNLPPAIFQQKMMSYLPSNMVYTVDRNLLYPPKVDIFRQKVETYESYRTNYPLIILPQLPF